ncbi:hypothetical protein COB21_02300 [Candidatus Aerophobetes bacterium]|uniref:Peptidase M16C associated domain-containing protein n=1 Tax=Aerophobetes bacterium TaxID=2030807 RepID=A0A2A4X790_UNCAE|nr:MAG: hypothetical protein COB21_02300 [Candidatus Aerophobetes bacterium]
MHTKPRYAINETIEGFTVKKASFIEELGMVAYELLHTKTGATVIQLENEDVENMFVISVQTLPSNSKGTAHILEHIALCGSKKYPIPDPFFSMTRRSLNTFMNAMTGSDFTCYPAASKVEKDYFNLLEVYLDAVFHPLLDKMSFLQEGHRLEIKNFGKDNESLENHGVVYNEMKGSLSSSETRLWHEIMLHLFEKLPYRHNSGGEPSAIANLSYEELLKFHQTFYTPSDAIFFFSGNIPLEKNLSFINTQLLNAESPKKKQPPTMALQPAFKKPKKVEGFYPCEDKNLNDKAYVAFSFVSCPVENQTDLLALLLLDSILMETDASPLKKALIDSKLCLSADSYIDQEVLQVPIAFVCQNSSKDKIDALEKLFFDTLKELKTKPFDQNLIDGAFLSLEFSRLEISRSFGPFALSLFWRSGLLKHHGIDIEHGLFTYSHLQNLKKAIKDPAFFSNLIDQYFLNNPSYVRLLFSPSKTLRQEEEKALNSDLAKKLAAMNTLEKEALIKQEKTFALYQENMAKQSLECLPNLSLSDIPLEGDNYALTTESFSSFTLYHHTSFTNHIIYAELFMEIPHLSEEEMPFLKLLCDLLPHLGAGKRNSDENLIFINSHLGDFHSKLHIFNQWGEEDSAKVQWSIGGKVMEDSIEHLFTLFNDTLTNPHLSAIPTIEKLITQITSSIEAGANQRAMGYAKTLSCSTLSKSGRLRELWYGLSYANFLLDIKKQFAKSPDKVIASLKNVWGKITCNSGANNFVLTCDQTSRKKITPYLNAFNLKISTSKNIFTLPKIVSLPSLEGKIITSPVAFCASSFSLPLSCQKIAPFIGLSTYMMENLFLHPTIREKGGAYGSGAAYHALSGNFVLHSYRDPHIKGTFNAFDKAFSIFTSSKVSEQDLSQAILGMIQDLDSPLSPGDRGVAAYSYLMIKKSFKIRQELRGKMLNAQLSDIVDAVQSVITNKNKACAQVAFSNKDKLSSELKDLPAHISPVFNLDV